jgi:hypothetical protein
MKIYISGKISGLTTEEALNNFERAEKYLHENQNSLDSVYVNELVNPMKLEHNHDKTWVEFMKEDISALLTCDAIYLLKNWGDSRGARIERAIALELGIKIIYEI